MAGSGVSRATRLSTLAAAVLVASAGCTATTSTPGDAPSREAARSSTPAATAVPTKASTGAVIELDCRAGASGLNHQGERMILGVGTDMWSADAANFDLSHGPSYDGSTLVKSPLYVSAEAGPGTRIEVTAPATARLFYTSWDVWGHDITDRSMVTGARRAVTAGGCGREDVGFPGGFVLRGPSCVTVRITSGDGGQRRDVQVPIGRNCGSGS